MNPALFPPPLPLNDEAPRVAPGAESGVGVVTPSALDLARITRRESEIRVVLAVLRSCPVLRRGLVESLASYHLVMIDCRGYSASYAKERFSALLESSGYEPGRFDLSYVYGVSE